MKCIILHKYTHVQQTWEHPHKYHKRGRSSIHVTFTLISYDIFNRFFIMLRNKHSLLFQPSGPMNDFHPSYEWEMPCAGGMKCQALLSRPWRGTCVVAIPVQRSASPPPRPPFFWKQRERRGHSLVAGVVVCATKVGVGEEEDDAMWCDDHRHRCRKASLGLCESSAPHIAPSGSELAFCRAQVREAFMLLYWSEAWAYTRITALLHS